METFPLLWCLGHKVTQDTAALSGGASEGKELWLLRLTSFRLCAWTGCNRKWLQGLRSLRVLKPRFRNLTAVEFQFKPNAENLKTILYVHGCQCQKRGSECGLQMPWIKKHVNKNVHKDKHGEKLVAGRLLVGTRVAGCRAGGVPRAAEKRCCVLKAPGDPWDWLQLGGHSLPGCEGRGHWDCWGWSGGGGGRQIGLQGQET